MTCTFATAASAADQTTQLINPILAQGVIGVCLVALAIWYIIKDKKYEKRIDDQLKREREIQDKFEEQSEKYRVAMEHVSKTLDVVVSIVKDR